MQSVVTGQAPTLERKNTSAGKQIKQHTRNKWNKIVHLRHKYKGEISVRAYIRIKMHIISYAQRVAADTETEPRRQHSNHKKSTAWNKRCPNRNRKWERRAGVPGDLDSIHPTTPSPTPLSGGTGGKTKSPIFFFFCMICVTIVPERRTLSSRPIT